jgi:hypothetical protein
MLKIENMTENRFDLVKILKDKNLNNIGVEIGVAFGNFSDAILEKAQFQKFYSIDPWCEISGDTIYSDGSPCILEYQDAVYNNVVSLLSKYGDRSEIIRDFSHNASKKFEDESIDFIYIDGSHKKEDVTLDLESWYPKLKIGGLCAGHDYLDGLLVCRDNREFISESGTETLHESETRTTFGVKSAVDEFVNARNIKLNIIEEETIFHSWFFIKE